MIAACVKVPRVRECRGRCAWVLATALLALGCRQGASRDGLDAAPPDRTPDAEVDSGALDAGGGGHDSGHDASTHWDAELPGGDAALEVGDAATGADASAPVVQNCLTFTDRSTVDADRTLAWNFDLGALPERCMQIAVGQSVTWSGAFRWHPLSALGGDLPSPIPGAYPDEGDHSLTFPVPGTYGFICEVHTEMRGAIRVVP